MAFGLDITKEGIDSGRVPVYLPGPGAPVKVALMALPLHPPGCCYVVNVLDIDRDGRVLTRHIRVDFNRALECFEEQCERALQLWAAATMGIKLSA